MARYKEVNMQRTPLARFSLIMLLSLALSLVLIPTDPAQAEDSRFFPETNHTVTGKFLEFWDKGGGLATYGFPISEAQNEVDPETGKTFLTQWFQRNRFELHPENFGTQGGKYDVLFGLLGKDFHYRVFTTRPDGRALWATTSTPGQDAGAPAFGRATAVYNVIDSRQAYLQQLLKQALTTIGFASEAEASTHFSYEMVALSHATARALGYASTESTGKPFVEVSGRKGLGVKADDLIDRLVESALAEVTARNPDLDAADRRRTAEAIAIAAVRYFLVKFTRTKIIAFDIDEALSFEGETGPYLQYATVRAGNILAKLKDRDGVDSTSIAGRLAVLNRAAIDAGEEGDELWGLVLEAARLDDVVDAAVRALELSLVAKYAFSLAQAFNAFYHRQQILKEEREDARLWRAAAVLYARRQLTVALDLMGCQVPSRM